MRADPARSAREAEWLTQVRVRVRLRVRVS